MNDQIAVLAEHLFKSYNGHPALVDVSMEIPVGLRVALLGANGAGKTTLLRVMSGLLAPESGIIRVFGEDPRESRSVRSRMVCISSDMGLYPRLTVREFLSWSASVYGLPPAFYKQTMEMALEILHLTPFADWRCETLSTGNRQKVHLARALVVDADLLILDEPAAGLDFRSAFDLAQFILSPAFSQKTILFTTHQLWEAELIAQKLAILHCGALIAFDRPEQVKNQFGVSSLSEIFLKVLPGGHG
ncbi:MAG: ABC transporter ATP-binding protein [bacterium JZ-2024 1]